MRSLLHVGLAALLAIAPAFCCCNVRLLTGWAAACCPEPVPESPPCCTPKAKPAKPSCRHEAAPAPAKSKPKPATPQVPACKCLGERPDANLPEAAPTVADPEPTGGLVPLAVLGLAGVPPEHLGLLGGLDPPGWAGVDAKSASLFDRHVLRC